MFSGEFVFTPSDKGKIVSVTAGDGWTNNTGNSASFMFTSTEGISASKFDLATVVLEVEEGVTGCTLTVSNPSVGGKIEIEVDVEGEVSTGATLPLTILACGVGAVAVIYIVSKKNKKLRKLDNRGMSKAGLRIQEIINETKDEVNEFEKEKNI